MENTFGVFMKKLIKRYSAHNIAANSAQVAYYWIMAFFPFLIVVISLLTFANLSIDMLIDDITLIVPPTLMPFIETTIYKFILYRSTTLLSVGVLISLWSGGTAVNALLRGIHLAYNSKFIRPYWLSKIVSIIYTIVLAMLLILMMVALVFGNNIGNYVISIFDLNKGIVMPIWNVFRLVMPFCALIIILYIVYRVVPRKHLKVKNVWLGTIAASVGWYVFSLIFSIYVENYSKYNQLYGSIGGVFILLIWLYASCMVLLIGAEINAVYQEMKLEKVIRQMS